jgi:hypothetical protein
MSVYRIYNQGEIARFAGACPGPRVRALRGPRINSGRGRETPKVEMGFLRHTRQKGNRPCVVNKSLVGFARDY